MLKERAKNSRGVLTVVAFLGAVLMLAISGCGPAASVAADQETRPSGSQAHWRVAGMPGSRSVTISSSVGYCDGDPKPRYGKILVRSRRSKVFITPFVVAQSRAEKGGFCDGLGWYQYRTLKLSRPVAKLKLYDASTRPPSLRWPRPSSR